MGALEAVRWTTLPPAGERIHVASAPAHAPLSCFDPDRARFFASGTAALAAAVRAAMARAGRREAEVLLPAYTCPNVVSAVLHAGARPRLVDLEPGRPWMSTDALRAQRTAATVAVIAVDFLGVPERYDRLLPWAREARLTLIQDSAQAFPRRGEQGAFGDFVVLSFGRGKPVSVLGGGAVLARDPALAALLPAPPARVGGAAERLRLRLQVLAYNVLRSPRLYGLPSALPLLHLGETRFTPLARIEGIDTHRLRCLDANVHAHWRRSDWRQRALGELAAECDGALVDLAAACCPTSMPRLARYPLLIVDPRLRDRLYRALRRAGLGASVLYGHALPRVRGLEGRWCEDDYPAAEAFAQRLLTLPLHDGVTRHHLRDMGRQFSRILRGASPADIAQHSV